MTRRCASALLLLYAATGAGACGKSRIDPPDDRPLPSLSPPNGELRWAQSGGGGSGFLPIGEDDEKNAQSFFAISDVRGVKSVLTEHKRAALIFDPDVACTLAPTLSRMRERASVNLFVGKPITTAAVACLLAIRPPAISFTLEERGALSAPVLSVLTHLDGCEALGVESSTDAVALLLGERADSPDGASLTSITLSGSRLSPGAIAALAKRKKLRAIGLRGMMSANPAPARTGLDALATLPDLERLDLSYGPVTDEDIAAFSGAKSLRWIMLESTQLTDAGVEAIIGLPALRSLMLPTAISPATVERWKREHPRVTITR